LTHSQLDKLGERLKTSGLDADKLTTLARFRNGFIESTNTVARRVATELMKKPYKAHITQRPAKSTGSIVAKLLREHIRLSQMQDIGGARIVVSKVSVQDRAVEILQKCYPGARIVDRRLHPQHGYRAVHVIVDCGGLFVEVQVRTHLQNLWAQYSEKLSDESGTDLKYGLGPPEVLQQLAYLSEQIAALEGLERALDVQRKEVINDVHERRRTKTMDDDDVRLLAGYDELLRQKRAIKVVWRRFMERVAE
jgi:ppGpp synthetase/RelA/SpoT-type nucleotidyltranferase